MVHHWALFSFQAYWRSRSFAIMAIIMLYWKIQTMIVMPNSNKLIIYLLLIKLFYFYSSAFFWLVSLLLSSLWWFAVVPLREQLAFGLVFSVIFQEAFRLVFYVLIRFVQLGKTDMGSIRLWKLELLFFLNGIGIDNLEFELKFGTKKLNPQINLPLNFLIQKYFFHD